MGLICSTRHATWLACCMPPGSHNRKVPVTAGHDNRQEHFLTSWAEHALLVVRSEGFGLGRNKYRNIESWRVERCLGSLSHAFSPPCLLIPRPWMQGISNQHNSALATELNTCYITCLFKWRNLWEKFASGSFKWDQLPLRQAAMWGHGKLSSFDVKLLPQLP